MKKSARYELPYLPDEDELKDFADQLLRPACRKHIDGYVDLFGDLKTPAQGEKFFLPQSVSKVA
uniref:Uncharacterized protein n=1 Tax=Salmonella sp. TaxID=599 RepID=A0A482ETK2_SALSP|nr:hypothetical protein [Salmonella sp.]QBM91537.1 hypothetical protein NNIBIDOC_00211 [Salmonella sp.]